MNLNLKKTIFLLLCLTMNAQALEQKVNAPTYEQVIDYATKQISGLSTEAEVYGALDAYGITVGSDQIFRTLRYQETVIKLLTELNLSEALQVPGEDPKDVNESLKEISKAFRVIVRENKIVLSELNLMRELIKAAVVKLGAVDGVADGSLVILRRELIELKREVDQNQEALKKALSLAKALELDLDLKGPVPYRFISLQSYAKKLAGQDNIDPEVTSLEKIEEKAKGMGLVRLTRNGQSLYLWALDLDLESEVVVSYQGLADFTTKHINNDPNIVSRRVDELVKKSEDLLFFLSNAEEDVEELMGSVRPLILKSKGVEARQYLIKYFEISRGLDNLRTRESLVEDLQEVFLEVQEQLRR